MRLPFLNEKDHWPTSKDPEEIVANPSHDTQLQDHLLDEVLKAIEKKDPVHIKEAVMALIHSIQNEEQHENG